VKVEAVLACGGNNPNLQVPADISCAAAANLCPQPQWPAGSLMYWIYTSPTGAPGTWAPSGSQCLTPAQAAAVTGRPAFTLADFRRLPLPAAKIVTQPSPTDRSILVNVPTNLMAQAKPVILTTTLLGTSIRVRATPARFTWTLGDGKTLATADPGAAYPDLRVTHTYTQAGTRKLGLVTAYSGEYALPGGPWIPITGTATVASAPLTLTVIEAHTELVPDGSTATP
jgi:hypothetical protein